LTTKDVRQTLSY